ncbi:DUF1161 domain-containing protein [Budviciaceae bacterium BWR-B9]|uniref:DUF1161 domain-containing protein n=1 Tax=Limnobaculum allomyrinae TaxID=2791986 RepID=A0ABS1IKR2_9GAMM|nr:MULTISPECIES: DUF1161 domain-containing protein [Limnobaculum]MBK5142342.1 DUF1161 domain-containing protein [Limnobaculum allomyrinae]MBV7690773.1 DUF1161 domain-containing protein [Limnobaculum sp. M2-1]
MKKSLLLLTATLLLTPLATFAATCDEIKAEIAQKIINNGVPESGFQLSVVPVEQAEQTGETVVGNCEQGKQKIVYSKHHVAEATPVASDNSISEKAPVVEDTEHPDLQPQTQP